MKDGKLFDISNGFDVAVQAKNKFAKLLASENIFIEFRQGVQPHFDVISRVLRLPIWKDYPESCLDRFLGHEVSHAVFTPVDETKKINEEMNILKQNSVNDPKALEKFRELKAFFMFLNCVEDVRIEKLIIRKFPGLYAQFKDSSFEFIDRDYFDIKKYNNDYSKVNLADRINLFFKLDIYCNELKIDFDKQEEDIVSRIAKVETFTEVKILAKELMDICKIKHPEMFSKIENETGLDEISKLIDSIISTQKNWNEKLAETSNVPAIGANSNINSQSQIKAEFVYQSEESSDEKRIFDRLVPLKDVVASFKPSPRIDLYAKKWFHYTKEIDMYLASMIGTFNRKKSAKTWQNKQKNILGELDLNALFKYKISDDIFKSETIVRKGKNHTIVMFIDYSSSMSDTMPMVLQQLYLMVKFCRLAGVKHVIYGFTDRGWTPPKTNTKKTTIEMSRNFKLVELFNHSMRERELLDQFVNLYSLNYIPGLCKSGISIPASENAQLRMGGTPLNDTLMLAHSLLPLIKEQHKSDVMSVIMLTDGDSNGTVVVNEVGQANNLTKTSDSMYITSRVSGKSYKIFDKQATNYDITAVLAQMIKEDYGYNLINFHILESYYRDTEIEMYLKRYLNKDSKKLCTELINTYKQDGRVLFNKKISRVWDVNIISKDSMLEVKSNSAKNVRQTQQILELVVSLIS